MIRNKVANFDPVTKDRIDIFSLSQKIIPHFISLGQVKCVIASFFTSEDLQACDLYVFEWGQNGKV